MRNIDTERLRNLADRRPGFVRYFTGVVLLALPSFAISGCISGIITVLFIAVGAPTPIAFIVAISVAMVCARIVESAWERSAGLTRPRPNQGATSTASEDNETNGNTPTDNNVEREHTTTISTAA